MKNLTDFCKTVETGMDPRLGIYQKVVPNILLFNLVLISSHQLFPFQMRLSSPNTLTIP